MLPVARPLLLSVCWKPCRFSLLPWIEISVNWRAWKLAKLCFDQEPDELSALLILELWSVYSVYHFQPVQVMPFVLLTIATKNVSHLILLLSAALANSTCTNCCHPGKKKNKKIIKQQGNSPRNRKKDISVQTFHRGYPWVGGLSGVSGWQINSCEGLLGPLGMTALCGEPCWAEKGPLMLEKLRTSWLSIAIYIHQGWSTKPVQLGHDLSNNHLSWLIWSFHSWFPLESCL